MGTDNLTRIETSVRELVSQNRALKWAVTVLAVVVFGLLIVLGVLAFQVSSVHDLQSKGDQNGKRTNCRSAHFDPYYAAQGQASIDLISSSAGVRAITGLPERTPDQLRADAKALRTATAGIQPDVLERDCGRAK